MKILHILNSTNGGGVGGTLEFINHSIKKNDDIVHIIVVPNQINIEDLNERYSIGLKDVKIIYVPMHWWNKKSSHSTFGTIAVELFGLFKTWFHFLSIFKIYKIIKKFDIDFVYTTTACIKCGSIASSWANVPHIWHIKERIGENGFMNFRLNDKELIQYINDKSDLIITMSEYIAQIFYDNMDRKLLNLHVVADGFDLKKMNNDNKHNYNNIENTSINDQLNIGLISSLGSTIKRHDIFINAAIDILNSNKNVKFIIFGDIPKKSRFFQKESYSKYLSYLSLIKELNLEEKIVFAGHINNIENIMDEIDILTHCCDKEGFGRVIIEGMAFSKPIIVPDEGGASEIVINDYNGLHFKSGDYLSLSKKINNLISDNDIRLKFGKNGYKRFLESYNMNSHYLKITNLIKNLPKA